MVDTLHMFHLGHDSTERSLYSIMYRLILNLLSGQLHWVKSVQIRSFSGPYFPAFGLNTERYGVSHYVDIPITEYLSVFSPNAGKYRPEKLRICTLFTQF